MDVLNLEIQIAQNDLQNVEINLNAGELMVAGISLTGDEVNEVLSLVRRLKEQKLAHLVGLQNEGATS
jgi:hypothetical protein